MKRERNSIVLVTQTDGRREFRSSPEPIQSVIGFRVLVVVVGLCYLSPLFGYARASSALLMISLLGVIMIVFGVRSLAMCWRSRALPLIVEGTGRVLYDAREICAAGAVQSVSFRVNGGEGGDWYRVGMLLSDGSALKLLSSYFGREFRDEEPARSFANELAHALGVGVVDS